MEKKFSHERSGDGDVNFFFARERGSEDGKPIPIPSPEIPITTKLSWPMETLYSQLHGPYARGTLYVT